MIEIDEDMTTAMLFRLWAEECMREFPDLARGRIIITGSKPRRYYACTIDTVRRMVSALRANMATRRSVAKHRLVPWGEWLLDRLYELDAASPTTKSAVRCTLCERIERVPETVFTRSPYVQPIHEERRLVRGAYEGRVVMAGQKLCERCHHDSQPTTPRPARSRRSPLQP